MFCAISGASALPPSEHQRNGFGFVRTFYTVQSQEATPFQNTLMRGFALSGARVCLVCPAFLKRFIPRNTRSRTKVLTTLKIRAFHSKAMYIFVHSL